MSITVTPFKNRITLLFLIVFFQQIAFNTQAQMRQLYVDTFTVNNHIKKISFYTPNEGYVAFNYWIGYTSDSGHTVTKKFITGSNVNAGNTGANTLSPFQIWGVKAFNRDTIIVYGSYDFVPAILYSTNQGNGFTVVNYSSYNSQQLYAGFLDMVFPENNATGYAVDEDRVLKTTNRGQSWSVVRNGPGSGSVLEAVNNNIVFSISNNQVFKTTNGGSTWQAMSLPAGNPGYINFIDANKGWVSINNSTNNGLYYTSNGGLTWILKNNPAFSSGTGKMKFINDSTGYFIGELFNIYKTTDSGRIWEKLPRDNNYEYFAWTNLDITFWNNTQFWAGGGQGFLQITANGGGTPLPKAYFGIDTAGVYTTGVVSLKNYSKQNYQYKWYKNGVLISSSYNTSYTTNFFHPLDTLMLTVSNGTSNDTSIKYQNLNLQPPLPFISNFTPTSGSVGTSINIIGSNFTGVTSVSFGGTLASSFIINSATSITAIVAGGSTGSISVTTQYGTAITLGFVYNSLPAPIITSFAPTSGPAGTTVTISGINFNPVAANNIIYFGASKAVIVSASATQILVQAPTGCTYKPITVLNTASQLTGFSAQPFLVTFPGGGGSFTPNSFEDVLNFFPTTSSFSSQIATGDFNEDGKPDIVIAPNLGLKLTVYKNNSTAGAMSFFEAGSYFTESTGVKIGAIVIADIDNDGKLDIITGRDSNFNSLGTISIIRNTSSGGNISFAPKIDLIAGEAPKSLAINDIDGDGKPDIVAARTYYGTPGLNYSYSIFKNTSTAGNVTFTQRNDFGTTSSSGIEIADVDNDHRPDIIVTQFFPKDSTLSIYKNISTSGNFQFTSSVNYKTSDQYPHHIYAGDLDKDDKPDIIVSDTYGNKFSSFRNIGTQGAIVFANKVDFNMLSLSSGGDCGIGDLNGDGKLDYAAATSHLEILNNLSLPGSISFATGIQYLSNSGSNCLADFDGDGKTDICQARWSGSIHIYRNKFVNSHAYAGTDRSICLGNSVQLGTTPITGNNYSWTSSPIGFTSSISNPNVNPAITTNYYLTVSNGTITASDTVVITVNPNPIANAGTDKTICSFANVTIGTPSTGNNTYSWTSNPGGFTSTNASPTVNPAITTNYYLTVTNSFGCTTKDTVIINISSSVANAGIDKLLCPGNSTSIGIIATSDTYSWTSNPVGFTSAISNPVVSPLVTTNYFLAVTNSLGCIAKDTVTISVGLPIANAGIDKTICSGGSTSIGITGNAINIYSWTSNPVGFTSTIANPNANPVVTTDYFLTVTNATNGTCVAKDTVTVNVNNILTPVVAITASNTNICTGTNISFSAVPTNGGTTASYQWQVNGINTGTNSNTFTTSSLTNNAQVKVILTSSLSCAVPTTATSNIITMAVTPAPVANAGNDIAICTGGTAQLSGSGGTTYSWSPSTGLSNPNIANPIASPAATTAYILTVANGNNCSSKDTVVVTVNQPIAPAVSISTPSNNICLGNAVTFTALPANGGANPAFQWQVNGVNAGTNSNTFTSNTINNASQIKTILTSNSTCATPPTATSNVITMAVQQLAVPLVTLSSRVYTVTNPDAGATYTWQTSANGIWANVVPVANGIIFTASAAGEYRVMATKGPCVSYSLPQVTSRASSVTNNPYGIYLYPNPTSKMITLDSIQLSQNWETLDITNAEGRRVLPILDIKNKNTVSIDVSSFRNGFYFVQLRRKDGEFTTIKFVKQ
jgi:photosystem II stability/assembly factor-like uncharacterized protein